MKTRSAALKLNSTATYSQLKFKSYESLTLKGDAIHTAPIK